MVIKTPIFITASALAKAQFSYFVMTAINKCSLHNILFQKAFIRKSVILNLILRPYHDL